MMVRKLAAALLGVGVFIPGLANALGLGEIRLNSALSEPLDAEIELVQVRELTATEILPSLASEEDFNAAGVDRFQILGDLKFEVVIGDKGRSYIKVRSRKPIKEPFLNFLVEVNWPAGRLLREYTMLLDPPIYSGKQAEPVRQAQAAPAPAPRPAPVARPEPSYTQAPEPSYTPEPAAEAAPAAGADSHTITSNDSLWGIAQKLKPSSAVTIQQTMIALQRHNPDAFIDGNINLLRRGQVLRAPSEAQIQEISSREAIELVAEQNRLWRERIAGRKPSAAPEAQQVDLSGRTADRPAPSGRVSDEGRLKLLAGADGTGDSGQGGTEGGGGELRTKLVQAEENIDKFKLENEDLKVKMSDLQEQLDTSEKVLSLKDQQIAALQAKLAEMERQTQQAAAAGGAATAPAQEPPADVQPLSATIDEPVAPPPAETPAEQEVTPVSPDVDFNYQEEAAAPAEAAVEPPSTTEAPVAETPVTEAPVTEEPAPGLVMEEEIEPVVQQPVVEAPVQAAPEPAPAQQQDLLTQLMSNPLYLGIGGGAIVLLLVAGLMMARRKKQEETFDETIDDNFQLPETKNELQDEMDIDLNEPVDDIRDEVEAPREETVPQTADVLGEADIYIAYGRYPQAIEMLQKAAEKEPNRADIRMKLCEVCADAKEPQTFMTHYRALQALGTTAMLAKADDLRARVAPGVEAEEEADDFEQAFASESTSQPVDDAESFDFDISEDATVMAAPSALDQEADSGLDFDLGDLEDTGASFASETKAATAQEDAGLDFDLEFDSAPAAAPATARDDSSLDFDLDLGGNDSFAPPTAKADDTHSALDFDAEFSLDDVDSSVAKSSDSSSAFDADLSLDFDQMETAPAAPVAEDAGLDFDLDFDVSSPAAPVASAPVEEPAAFDFEEDHTIAFTPKAPAPASAGDEPVLDSAAAAQLADELDFDMGLESASAGTPAPADEDATIMAAPAFSAKPAVSAPSLQPAANDFSSSAEDELDFLSDADETSTKLDLARAYIDMGDRDGARDILDEVMIEGSDNQKQEAKDLLMRLES